MRVLVVDPNAAEREVTSRALTSEKHEVECAKDAAGAITALDKKRPDVILVESTMIGVTGAELVKRTRAAEDPASHLYVIMTASRAVPGDIKAAFAAGADDFIRKPLNKEELLARIEGVNRVRTWMQRMHAGGSSVDLSGSGEITATQSWAQVDANMSSDVGDMLGMTLTPTESTNVMKGAFVGAMLPLSMASESFEVRVGVAVDKDSARVLAGAMLGSEDASESDVRDMLRELANVAAGAFKRTSAGEGRVLTTGLPSNGAPTSFTHSQAKARREWTATCTEIGATLRFEVQYISSENKHLPVKSLKEGMVLAHDLLNASGALLMRGGTRLTESQLNQLPRALGDSALVAVMAAAA